VADFQAGDACLIFDQKGRRYLIELIPGAQFHLHHGLLPHDEIIGSEEGTTLRTSLGRRLVALRPRLADFALKMPRGATVVYPKDSGAILIWADIRPGDVVVEAGTGSGALTMALARAVGATGKVISYEARHDHAALARKRIRGFFGHMPEQIDLRVGRVEEELANHTPNRVILDLPEPWHSVPVAARHLAADGIFCCYLPTVPQVQEVRAAIDASKAFLDVMTFEMMMREWAVEGRSVRPNHRMVGHTGFITIARKRQPAGDQ
jgi:tRNA (adenine57-N1/adenine58-N1)-methyltransferase